MKESHLKKKNPMCKKQPPRTFQQQSGREGVNSPVHFNILYDRIHSNSLATTIHRIFQCFLEMQKFTGAVF